jgi:hypothetical protein
MSKNLNSELKKRENFTCALSRRGVKGSPGAMGHGSYRERPTDYMTYINHLLSEEAILELDKLRILRLLDVVSTKQNVMPTLLEVLDQILLIFVSFLCCTVVGYAKRPNGRGSG